MSDGPLPNVTPGLADRFRPDASLPPLLPASAHPAGCDCRRCWDAETRPANVVPIGRRR